MKKTTRTPLQLGLVVVFLILVLCILGLIFVFEASVAESLDTFGDRYYLFKQHALGLGVGWIAFMVGLLVPSKFWVKSSPLLILAGLCLLALVFVPGIGLNLNGASRWLSVGGLTVQPVEFFKFTLIAYLATWLPKKNNLASFALLMSIPAILLILQPDLGSLLVVFAIATSMYFISGSDLKHFAILGMVSIPLVLFAILLSPYRMERLTTFFNPETDPLGSSYHVRQIILALGRGGLFGQGIGNSTQRFSYIPEASTDSIFAIVGEEIGFLGGVFIISLFISVIFMLQKIVSQANRPIEIRLLGYGLVIWITIQTLLNLSAVVALVPLTGVPLPFFSYGRSSLIMLLFATGIILRTGKKA